MPIRFPQIKRIRGSHPSSQGDYQWRQLREKFLGVCQRSNALCHICVERGDIEHAAIDYYAKPQSPLAFEADHLKPVAIYPHLRYEWANLAASHSRCNRQRSGTQAAQPQPVVWVKPDW